MLRLSGNPIISLEEFCRCSSQRLPYKRFDINQLLLLFLPDSTINISVGRCSINTNRQEENMKMIKGVEKMIEGEMIRRSQKVFFVASLIY